MKKLILACLLMFSAGWLVAAEINDLEVTDASNTGRFPENMAPSAVNDGARALEGIIARWAKDTDGRLLDTGSGNAYVVAASQTISAYYDGLTIGFEASFSNTSTATLNVDSVGAQEIVWPDGTGLSSGDIPSGAKVLVTYDLDNTRWQLKTTSNRPVSDPLTTQGDLITSDGSSAIRLAIGSSSTVLQSNGSDPSWGAVTNDHLAATARAASTQTIWVPAGAFRPTASSPTASLADHETTAGRPDINYLAYDPDSEERAQLVIAFPTGWDEGAIKYRVSWAASSTSTNTVLWKMQCVAISDDDTIDVAYGTAVTVASSHTGTLEDLRVTAESAQLAVGGSPAANDNTWCRLDRDAAGGSDDLAVDAWLVGVKITFVLDSANDD